MSALNIRKLGEDDALAWWHLRLESLEIDPAAFSGSVPEHLAIDIETIKGRFRQPSGSSINLGAFDGEKLVGMVLFARVSGEKQYHKGRISALYVSASHRCSGTARKLLTRLFEIIQRDFSLEQILVSVSTTQVAACSLYRSFGFEVYGIEPAAMKVGTVYIDSYDMVWLFKREEFASFKPLSMDL